MNQFNTCGFVSETKTAQQKSNTQEVNSKATKFYFWFRGLGGNLSNFDPSELMQKFQTEEGQRVFKTKPDHVKKELNHKFTFNL